MRIMGKVVDDNCIAILMILAFFLIVESMNSSFPEGYSDYPFASPGDSGSPTRVAPSRETAMMGDPNMKPVKMKMAAPPSMTEEYAVLSGSPIKTDGDYLLLDPSLRSKASIDTFKPISGQVVTDRPTAGKLDVVLDKQMMGVGQIDSVGSAGLAGPAKTIGRAPSGPGPGQGQGQGQGQGKHKEVRLIMLFAPWCGYSKKARPDFEKVIEQYHGQMVNGTMVKVLLYDTDKRKDMVEKYKVKGFPSYILEMEGHDGKVDTKAVNERSADKLGEAIKSAAQ